MSPLQTSENALLIGAVACYFVATLLLWSQLFFHADDISEGMERWHRGACAWGERAMLVGAGLHAFALVGQGTILFYARVGVAGLIGWILAILYLAVGRKLGHASLGAFVAPVVLVAALYSLFDPALHRAARAENLERPWLVIHVVLLTLSFSVLALAFAASVVYVLQERLLKRKRLAGLWQRLPPLGVVDDWTYRATTFGLAALTLGMMVGLIWQARHQPGYAMLADPKVLFTLATWATFALYLASRWWLGWRGRRTNLVVIYGFVLLLISFSAPHVLSGIAR